MAKKFKLMRTVERVNIDPDKDSMINLQPNSHTRNEGRETHIRGLGYQSH